MTANTNEQQLSKMLAITNGLTSDRAKMAVYDATCAMIAQLQERHNISQVNVNEVHTIANELYLRLERECLNRIIPI